jgi:hypothetical protein
MAKVRVSFTLEGLAKEIDGYLRRLVISGTA